MKLGFIGAGNMASAIINGFVLSEPSSASSIWVFDIMSEKSKECVKEYGVNESKDANFIAREMDYIVLAVKPADYSNLLEGITDDLKENNPMLVSIAAGNSIDYISSLLNYDAALARVMPNINATIGQAMSAYCSNANVSKEQEKFVYKICTSIGKAVKLEEKYFPAFGAIAGAGPAFVYLFIDELARAGVKIGLNKKLALDIATQTVLGSAKLISESENHPYELIDRVCSPGGTTIEGITTLRECGFANAITKAVESTYKKDIKLSKK